ncbi:hypothetical protein CDAR_279871 [Caerostris darwini]|uniref:Uncharacterized protein n=1 Tax=Caerostris darwini TaxID=1538125 RepID=A0AAV4WY76_9ARAC|nr:hypothetical protein CDAR_279871 [Caerostris darwini]
MSNLPSMNGEAMKHTEPKCSVRGSLVRVCSPGSVLQKTLSHDLRKRLNTQTPFKHVKNHRGHKTPVKREKQCPQRQPSKAVRKDTWARKCYAPINFPNRTLRRQPDSPVL